MGEVRCETHFKTQTALFCPVCMIEERDVLLTALRDLYEEVEMGEATGICLDSRAPALRARDLLGERDFPNG